MLFWLMLTLCVEAIAQAPSFDVASVKPSQKTVGPDYNNQFKYSPSAFTARNATLKALIAEAYRLQRRQVIGPAWIDKNEYDIDARVNDSSSREQLSTMLQSLLSERFGLRQHTETRSIRAFELTVAKSGPKLQPIREGATAAPNAGLHFRGDMRQFADLLAIQLSMAAPTDPNVPVMAGGPPVPVLDQTGLRGAYEFNLEVRPELGTDGLTLWQRVLQDQLGLRIESRKEPVTVLLVDDAAKTPSAN